MAKPPRGHATTSRVTCLGYGEAARAFVAGWRGHRPLEVAAFDIKTGDAGSREAQRELYAADGIAGHDRPADAIAGGEVVFSLVTAEQSLAAARDAADCELKGRLFLDCNSAAPATKQAAGELVDAAGGRYVDVAVMAPVHPALHRTPVLASGPDADEACRVMRDLDMRAEAVDGRVGTASGIKLCRSIIVKGIEALSAEMLLPARRLGIEEQVIASLDKSYPGFDWRRRGSYALDRMVVHGERRAGEMREAAAMLRAMGMRPGMSEAAAEWQAAVGALGAESGPDELAGRADRLLGLLGGG